MKSRKFSLGSLVRRMFKKRPAGAITLTSKKPASTSARDRVRSGIEPLEGRIAPAILVNGHLLTYSDADGDTVTVTFSRDIFNVATVTTTVLDSVFKFSAGKAHTGAANATDDVSQQLQLIDLGAVPTKLVHGVAQSQVAGISFTVTSNTNPASGQALGDGFAAIGAVKAGANALGTVMIDGDLGQIDAGTGTSKVGVGILVTQSIGKFGTTTQPALPTPDLTSEIKGRVGRIVVNEDVKGYLHVVDSTRLVGNVSTITQRGTIGQITIGGSLIGNATVATASDKTGRIESSFDIGTVSIAGGIIGGGGKNSGSIFAAHALGDITVGGNVEGGRAEAAGAIGSGGTLASVKIGGDLKGGTALLTGSVTSEGAMGAVTIGSAAVHHDLIGGAGERSGFIGAGTNLAGVHVFGKITGAGGLQSGKIVADGSVVSAIVDGI